MPEGPEVRRHADALHAALAGRRIVALTARTKLAKAWLAAHPDVFTGRRVERVYSHGKHLVGAVEGGLFFHSHLMMWGRWQVTEGEPPAEMDRRERARIVVECAAAILFSAPVFDVGEGDPRAAVENLASLGPDILPYADEEPFDEAAFRARLLAPEHAGASIGAALLNQRIAAGIGNYLRAEILFHCRLDPWRRVADLTADELDRLCRTIPEMARQAYLTGGVTVTDEVRGRMRRDASLVYQPGREWGTRHYVFRRTNLPCVECGGTVRQTRQVTHAAGDEEDERTRIIYFCPTCQGASVELKQPRRRAARAAQPAAKVEVKNDQTDRRGERGPREITARGKNGSASGKRALR
jgi:endonuclease VIII